MTPRGLCRSNCNSPVTLAGAELPAGHTLIELPRQHRRNYFIGSPADHAGRWMVPSSRSPQSMIAPEV